MEQAKKHRILNLLYLSAVIINMGSIGLTVYMMQNFSVVEANPIPAMIFSTYGFPVMIAVSLIVWSGMFLFVEVLRRTQGEKNIIFLKSGLVVIALTIISIDFVHNIDVLLSVI